MYDFSIVTPSLNQGRFIFDNLESISNQNNVTVEHIVMDGLSCDETMKVLSDYKSKHTFYWKSEADKGQTEAINKGLRLSTGAIIGYLNADDYLHSSDALHQVKVLLDKSGADILYGDVMVVDATGAYKSKITGNAFDFGKFIKRNFIPQPATFFRASVFEKIGPFREKLRYAMDLEYWLRCASHGLNFHYEPITISCFREHEESKTCSHTKALIDEGYGVVRKEYFPDKPIALWMYHRLALLKLLLK